MISEWFFPPALICDESGWVAISVLRGALVRDPRQSLGRPNERVAGPALPGAGLSAAFSLCRRGRAAGGGGSRGAGRRANGALGGVTGPTWKQAAPLSSPPPPGDNNAFPGAPAKAARGRFKRINGVSQRDHHFEIYCPA